MRYQHRVALTLGSTGAQLTNWDGYEVVLDLFQQGSPWSFSLWRPGQGERVWRDLRAQLRVGDRIDLAIDDAVQLTGRIEALNVRVSRSRGSELVLSGRDLAGPALTWHADPRVILRNTTVEHALSELYNRIGIEVVVVAHGDAAREVQTRARPGRRGAHRDAATRRNRVDLSRAREGETVHQVAESILRRLGLIAWVAPSDRAATGIALIVGVPDYDQDALYRFERRLSGGVVTQASRILESDLEIQIRDVPTVVYAAGRAPRDARAPARHVHATTTNAFHGLPGFLAYDSSAAPAPVTAPAGGSRLTTTLPYANQELQRWPMVIDPLPPQPMFLHTRRSRNPATARQETERVMAEAMRRFRTYELLVQGHGQLVGGALRLYAINTMAHVYDRLSELDEEMLVHQVRFVGSRGGGQHTRLTLGTKGAYVLTPEAS